MLGWATPRQDQSGELLSIDKKVYFVDLPGYGYARVSHAKKPAGHGLWEDYFADGQITVGLLIVDARHKPTADDQTMAQWFHRDRVPFIVVANKLDKLKKSEIEGNLPAHPRDIGAGGGRKPHPVLGGEGDREAGAADGAVLTTCKG